MSYLSLTEDIISAIFILIRQPVLFGGDVKMVCKISVIYRYVNCFTLTKIQLSICQLAV